MDCIPFILAGNKKTIKSLMRSSFGQIQPWTVELSALDRPKNSFYLRTILMTCGLSGERSLPFGLLVIQDVIHFGFEIGTVVLFAPVPGHCLAFTFRVCVI